MWAHFEIQECQFPVFTSPWKFIWLAQQDTALCVHPIWDSTQYGSLANNHTLNNIYYMYNCPPLLGIFTCMVGYLAGWGRRVHASKCPFTKNILPSKLRDTYGILLKSRQLYFGLIESNQLALVGWEEDTKVSPPPTTCKNLRSEIILKIWNTWHLTF